MGRGQAGGDLPADPQHVRQLERPGRVELLLQGSPGDVLHDQVGDRLLLDGVDGDDVLVADGRGRPRLAQEPLAGRRGRGQERGHELDGDEPMQLLVERLHHDPEAAVPEHLQHLVMRQPAQRAGLVRRLQEAQGILHIVAALVAERRQQLASRRRIGRA